MKTQKDELKFKRDKLIADRKEIMERLKWIEKEKKDILSLQKKYNTLSTAIGLMFKKHQN